ncbi:Fe(3+)-hydroxamate ABC transporter permease FhuB [Rhizobium sp. P38BS-XIX]|uniref:Fe(3+)-hydroxamate ABC transporter permease FhuB n=1 Tax=Rhizobium sp. P38BS-XIX TaxID=2726740 RepID=UPI0014567B2D|nr:Fe(3+)-hydroxamate ABC transporter permease FhuB [Rhizobium sp. P38BS-XIX]NLS00556.1 Fe(3+)-hydroxamate ABC transporter permease FhuB [Rhizobium sp. P38BS-XIX]
MHGTVDRRRAISGYGPLARNGALLGLACVIAFSALLLLRPHLAADMRDAAALDRILLIDSLLPRSAIAIVAGAALGLSGALLQRVLRNPIADASTLGIAAGSQLAMTIAVGLFPLLIGLPREISAFAGGLAAVLIVLALSWRRGLDPVTVALCGMMVTLVATALSVTIILARGEYAMSVFIWGAGALNQQSWDGVVALAPRLIIGFAAALVLVRPLTVMSLDDSSAKNLGIALHSMRFALLTLAVWLAASVTAQVGIIGFLGLAAPHIARFCGARRTGQLLIAAPLAGAGILFLTDCMVQLLSQGFTDLAPTGAATALLGGPLLLLLLPRLHSGNVLQTDGALRSRLTIAAPGRALVLLVLGMALLFFCALSIGRGVDGWHVAIGSQLSDLLPFRLPRTVVAATAGAMLAAAGFIMQRLTGNPLASPEILGVSAGGGAGLTIALFLFAFPSPAITITAMTIGALIAFLAMMAFSARGGFGPERLLLSGVAIGALCMAIVTVVLSRGDLRAFLLLTWLSGSTNRAGSFEAWTGIISLALIVPILPMVRRWFDVLPLGGGVSRSVGLSVAASRLTLSILAALLTAIASFLVGPLSLTGLIAPHLARLMGFRGTIGQLAASLLLGAMLLVLADWLSRTVIFPYEVPVGLFAALIGGPYLIWFLTRKET